IKPILTLNLRLAATLSVKSAPADDTAAATPTQSKPMAGMMEMMSPQPGFRLYGWIETGITGNFASPNDNQNFGRLLDDRANDSLLNQFVLTAERGLDPSMTDRFDWAFRIQFLYGSDARYLKTIGLFDLITDDTVQRDIPELWFLAHFPISGTTGGGRSTYGVLTEGVMIKPPKPALITDLMIRPELRYDRSLNGTHPFNDSSYQDMLTAA